MRGIPTATGLVIVGLPRLWLGMCRLSHLHSKYMDVLYGIHAVEEELRARPRSIAHIAVARERSDIKLQRIIDGRHTSGIPVSYKPLASLDRMSHNGSYL